MRNYFQVRVGSPQYQILEKKQKKKKEDKDESLDLEISFLSGIFGSRMQSSSFPEGLHHLLKPLTCCMAQHFHKNCPDLCPLVLHLPLKENGKWGDRIIPYLSMTYYLVLHLITRLNNHWLGFSIVSSKRRKGPLHYPQGHAL